MFGVFSRLVFVSLCAIFHCLCSNTDLPNESHNFTTSCYSQTSSWHHFDPFVTSWQWILRHYVKVVLFSEESLLLLLCECKEVFNLMRRHTLYSFFWVSFQATRRRFSVSRFELETFLSKTTTRPRVHQVATTVFFQIRRLWRQHRVSSRVGRLSFTDTVYKLFLLLFSCVGE